MINMQRYISGCIDDFEQAAPEALLKNVTTPATENLLKTHDDANEVKAVPMPKTATSDATVTKLLFVAKKGRPQILKAISFLIIKVKAST
jgi:hypothetical protein